MAELTVKYESAGMRRLSVMCWYASQPHVEARRMKRKAPWLKMKLKKQLGR